MNGNKLKKEFSSLFKKINKKRKTNYSFLKWKIDSKKSKFL